MFEDFPATRLIAIGVWILVMFCIILSIVFLMDNSHSIQAVHTIIGYAILLQLIVISLYLMRNKK